MDIILKDVRLSFPNLFTPVEFKAGDGKPRYDATFLVEPGSDNDKLIRKAINDAALEACGDAAKAQAFLKSVAGQKNQFCYLDGNTKSYDGYEGMWALATHRSAKNKKTGAPMPPPAIVDHDLTPLTASNNKLFGGCYVNAKVSIYALTSSNPGVFASFSVVQYNRKGEPFGNGAPSLDGMAAVAPEVASLEEAGPDDGSGDFNWA